MTLTDLKQRLEEITGPDREIDHLIWNTLGFDVHEWDPGDGDMATWREWANGDHIENTKLTASLEAAVTLCEEVLPGWLRSISNVWESGNLWEAEVSSPDYNPIVPRNSGAGAHNSEPIALLIAIIEALISKEATSNDG